ncbi:MAG: gliding motility-associated C-terminal domain-containing protein [Crocinitomicaceae bacterium]
MRLFSLFSILFCVSSVAAQKIYMTPNSGQWDDRIHYSVDLNLGKLYLKEDGMCFLLTDFLSHGEGHEHAHENEQDEEQRFHVIHQKFIQANSDARQININPSIDVKNYIIGNDSLKWKKNIHSFSEVHYENFYSDIDLIYKGQNEQLSYNFFVKPGADASLIKWTFEGATNVVIKDGALVIPNRFGEIYQTAPIAWEIDENGLKNKIAITYQIVNNEISFNLPEGHDHTKELYIDPSLTFSTFSGSISDNWGFTATPDLYGNLFGGGITMGTQYPTTTGAFDLSFQGGSDPYPIDIGITKFTANGSALLYSTYLGGSGNETPHSLVCADNGELFIYGVTGSSDFPMAGASFDNIFNGGPTVTENSLGFTGADIYIARLSASGGDLLASTYVGGTANDGLNTGPLHFNYGDQFRGEIMLDGDNNVYIASSTLSSDFPVNNAQQASIGGNQDAILFKMPPELNQLLWSTYFGGTGSESGNSIQVNDELGELCIAGGTSSNSLPFNQGNDLSFGGGISDGFVAKFNANTGSIISGTYMGFGEYDQTYFVQYDIDHNIYVYGQTSSDWPISPICFGSPNSGQFIRKYDALLNNIEWTTMIGASTGNVEISPTAFLVSNCYDIYLAGWGGSTNGSVPSSTTNGFIVTGDAHQTQTNGSNFYIAVLDQDASNLKYATFMGGLNSSSNHVDGGTSRFDKSGRIYHAVCGACGGNATGFTTTSGSFAETNQGSNCNMATFKFELSTIEAAAAQPAPLICIPQSVFFTNDSENGNAYLWTFGDGGTSTEEEPIYQYTEPGSYEVQLVVYDTSGCFSADSVTIIVDIGAFEGGVVDPAGPICPGESYELEAFGGAFYEWEPAGLLENPNSANPIATIEQTTTFTVSVSDTCGSQTLEVTLEVFNNDVEVSDPSSICLGESITLEATGEGTISWSPPLYLNDPNSFTPISTPDSSITYVAELTTADGCVNYDTTSINVYFDFPLSDLDDEVGVCIGTQTTIIASGGDSYSWIPDPYILNTEGPIAVIAPEFNQWFYVEIENACGAIIDSIYANVIEIEIQAGNDTIICPGEEAHLWAEGAVYYQWVPANTVINQFESQATVVPLGTTDYTVIGIDENECRDTAYVNVALYPYPSFETSNDVLAFYGDEIQLQAYSDQNGIFIWSPAEYLSCINCDNPIATPNQEITYKVTFIDLNGCESDEFINIYYDAVIYIPNTFTPDNNGLNETFQISGGNIKEMECLIFNRWGEILYTMTEPYQSWDGTFFGKECQDGTYIWKLTYLDFSNKQYQMTGHVNLIR